MLGHQEDGGTSFWNLRFYKNFHERELEAAFSFLNFIQSRISRGIGCNSPHWCLKRMVSSIFGLFIIRSGVLLSLVSLGRGAHGRILTLDNLMLRHLPLANRCCMCFCFAESVDHLLIHCPVAYSLWVRMLQVFGIQWVMPGSVESLVFCWCNWFGKFSSDI